MTKINSWKKKFDKLSKMERKVEWNSFYSKLFVELYSKFSLNEIFISFKILVNRSLSNAIRLFISSDSNKFPSCVESIFQARNFLHYNIASSFFFFLFVMLEMFFFVGIWIAFFSIFEKKRKFFYIQIFYTIEICKNKNLQSYYNFKISLKNESVRLEHLNANI